MQGQIPQNAEATQEKATGENNTPSTKEQLLALEAEIAESRAAIDKDFAKKFGSSLSEEQQQLMFNDPVAFLESYESAKLEHLEQDLAPKLQRHTELRNQMQDEAIMQIKDRAIKALLDKYPKANPEEVIAFMEQDLSPKQIAELNKLNADEVLIKVYELMPQNKGKELPQELNDLHDDGSLDSSNKQYDVMNID